MITCSRDGCPWRAIAPAESAAWRQYAEHLVEEHSRSVDVDIPDGMVQVRVGSDDDWVTTTFDEARALHDALHRE